MTEHRRCRLCDHDAPTDDLVKYSTRAYAHPACLFVRHGKAALQALPSHVIRALPVLPLADAGLAPKKTILDVLRAMEKNAVRRENQTATTQPAGG